MQIEYRGYDLPNGREEGKVSRRRALGILASGGTVILQVSHGWRPLAIDLLEGREGAYQLPSAEVRALRKALARVEEAGATMRFEYVVRPDGRVRRHVAIEKLRAGKTVYIAAWEGGECLFRRSVEVEAGQDAAQVLWVAEQAIFSDSVLGKDDYDADAKILGG